MINNLQNNYNYIELVLIQFHRLYYNIMILVLVVWLIIVMIILMVMLIVMVIYIRNMDIQNIIIS